MSTSAPSPSPHLVAAMESIKINGGEKTNSAIKPNGASSVNAATKRAKTPKSPKSPKANKRPATGPPKPKPAKKAKEQSTPPNSQKKTPLTALENTCGCCDLCKTCTTHTDALQKWYNETQKANLAVLADPSSFKPVPGEEVKVTARKIAQYRSQQSDKIINNQRVQVRHIFKTVLVGYHHGLYDQTLVMTTLQAYIKNVQLVEKVRRAVMLTGKTPPILNKLGGKLPLIDLPMGRTYPEHLEKLRAKRQQAADALVKKTARPTPEEQEADVGSVTLDQQSAFGNGFNSAQEIMDDIEKARSAYIPLTPAQKTPPQKRHPQQTSPQKTSPQKTSPRKTFSQQSSPPQHPPPQHPNTPVISPQVLAHLSSARPERPRTVVPSLVMNVNQSANMAPTQTDKETHLDKLSSFAEGYLKEKKRQEEEELFQEMFKKYTKGGDWINPNFKGGPSLF